MSNRDSELAATSARHDLGLCYKRSGESCNSLVFFSMLIFCKRLCAEGVINNGIFFIVEGTQMTWPPQSPDLNHTEMVWDELDRREKKKQPTSAHHLWELFLDCRRSFQVTTSWSRLRRCPDGAKQRDLIYKTYSGLFNTFLFTT